MAIIPSSTRVVTTTEQVHHSKRPFSCTLINISLSLSLSLSPLSLLLSLSLGAFISYSLQCMLSIAARPVSNTHILYHDFDVLRMALCHSRSHSIFMLHYMDRAMRRRSLGGLDLEAQIDVRYALRERAERDDVDPIRHVLAERLERDATRSLNQEVRRCVEGRLHDSAQISRCGVERSWWHVVKHHDVGAGLDGLDSIVEVLAFDLDLQRESLSTTRVSISLAHQCTQHKRERERTAADRALATALVIEPHDTIALSFSITIDDRSILRRACA